MNYLISISLWMLLVTNVQNREDRYKRDVVNSTPVPVGRPTQQDGFEDRQPGESLAEWRLRRRNDQLTSALKEARQAQRQAERDAQVQQAAVERAEEKARQAEERAKEAEKRAKEAEEQARQCSQTAEQQGQGRSALDVGLDKRFKNKDIINRIAFLKDGWKDPSLSPSGRSGSFRRKKRPDQDQKDWFLDIGIKKGRHPGDPFPQRDIRRRGPGTTPKPTVSPPHHIVKRQLPPKCKRKEYRKLTNDERKSFHEAVFKMKTTMAGKSSTSMFDTFVQYHQPSMSHAAHNGSAFLPWHREFLFRFELILQSFNDTVCLPYWDSTLDHQLPFPRDSIMWSNSPYFQGNNDDFVTSGAFRNWPVLPGCEQRGSRFLRRAADVTSKEALFQDRDIDYVKSQAKYEQVVSPNLFEWEHGGPHVYVGGHMEDLQCSPNDPMFWMHHCFVDYVWEDFRLHVQNTSLTDEYPLPITIHGLPEHGPFADMSPFNPLQNIHGLDTFYADYFYEYEPRVILCASHSDCGGELFCNRGRCASKVRLNGNCDFGFPEGSTFMCECEAQCLGGYCRGSPCWS